MSAIPAFLFSTPGKIILGVIAFFLWLSFHDAKIENRAKAECQAETLKKTLAEIQRQKDAADKLLADAEKQADESDREIAQLVIEKDQAVAEAKKLKVCEPVPPAVLDRLRRIR